MEARAVASRRENAETLDETAGTDEMFRTDAGADAMVGTDETAGVEAIAETEPDEGTGAAVDAARQTLTPLELEIMQVLWEAGPSTVSEVQPRLKAELAYTTVQTMLNVLLRKQKVARVQEGRAFRYRPAVSRERATGSALSDLVKRMFGGSGEALLLAMVDTRQITAQELARVAERLQAAGAGKREGTAAADKGAAAGLGGRLDGQKEER
jgi:BlaI family transcriptional regulator, penicillinase repressor